MPTQGIRQLGNIRGQMIRNVKDPVQDQDAATKAYVDGKITVGSGYVVFGTTQICWGVNNVSSSGTTISFPRAFSSAPSITTTISDPNFWGVWIIGKSTTYFMAKQQYTGGTISVNWIAIGVA